MSKFRFRYLMAAILLIIGLLYVKPYLQRYNHRRSQVINKSKLKGRQPLVMVGGDVRIRALMRTISASEANDSQPYYIIYGGDHVTDLRQHPNRCIMILTPVNFGKCTTAAGRYQFLKSTWDEKAKRYHPQPPGLMMWKPYSFEPEFQDKVVYAWLKDSEAWDADISELLKQNKLDQVLRLLSGTWTSLGYGIENNSVTGQLPKIYQIMLQDELQKQK